jgi:hypothetical protein
MYAKEKSNNNNKRRLLAKSQSLEEAIKQCSTKYHELNCENLLEKFANQHKQCYWCKTKLVCPKLNDTGCALQYIDNYNQPSIDRIDNDNKDHSISNINITCWMCNIMRGQTDIYLWKVIIDILLGKSDTIDLSQMNYIGSLWEKRFMSISPHTLKTRITIDNIRSLICPISYFPIFLGKENRHPLLPSFDRITNNDIDGKKLEHTDDNINMVCSFINFGRNNINQLEDFKDIFNKKFPNRTKNIKCIYPDNYKWRVEGNQFITEKTYIERQAKKEVSMHNKIRHNNLKKILQQRYKKYIYPSFNKLKKNVKYPRKQLRAEFQRIVSQYVRDIKNINKIIKWSKDNNRYPGYKDVSRDELNMYEQLSKLKNKQIYMKKLGEIPDYSCKPQSDINRELWKSQWLRLNNYMNSHDNQMPTDGVLSRWVSTQRKLFKKNDLSKERKLECEKIHKWWWTEIQQGYNKNLSWFESNPNKLPSKTKHKTEYNWFIKIRKMHNNDNLSDFEIDLIKNISIFKLWLANGKPMSKKDSYYKEFNNKYKYNN